MVFMPALDTGQSTIKPTHKAIQGYYAARQSFDSLHGSHEISGQASFHTLGSRMICELE